ncbi:hypothetical protein AJ80_01401 [Polytolypa hystricis UAMH7299]|uniref:ABC transporter domain-containing protein n=1 Tax=Polytolypa hystricis (strain UAMH7299) TaxID=1447883 RepID=A0A2B7Z170_POLH7|nr:hypothetical protein AJ80_01401 [Polytolypa hystricis UAMH7299]
MPPTVPILSKIPTHSERARYATENPNDAESHVHPSQKDAETLAKLHKTLTEQALDYEEPHSALDNYLKETRKRGKSGEPLGRLGVCFKNVSTWGEQSEHTDTKNLAHAIWRTMTFRDVYEWTLKPWVSPPKMKDGRPLIRDFSGVVRSGEIMLVLGRPGAGCSTFLRTLANHHSSFLGITGSIDYSGLMPQDISKHYRGEVAYIPEEDVHFPTLTVRQTLEFALESKTPKKLSHKIPEMMEIYGRVFGISHIMDSLVGDEYIRGISGGERKRLSIIESLAADPAVAAWDNSTRGLDAAAAVDYARSLRIMTNACGKATIVSLYQASDEVYQFVDKVMVIDDGRMLYQGRAANAKRYFEDLGYKCQPRQTTTDFLTSVTSPESRRFREGWESRTPKGPIELETAFRQSEAFQAIQQEIDNYERDLLDSSDQSAACSRETNETLEDFKALAQTKKSRYVSAGSSYNTSLAKQTILCMKRHWWLLKGDPLPLYLKMISSVVLSLLIASMFYNQPVNTAGAFTRGGFLFYNILTVAWVQLAELEQAVQGRGIISRQKRFAFVRPSAVEFARVVFDFVVVFFMNSVFSLIGYFMAGLQMKPGSFFLYFLFSYIFAVAQTSQFRMFASFSNFEVALRYSGLTFVIAITFSGYLLPFGHLITQVPWVGWLAYTTPVLYAYEACMAVEFHGLELVCNKESIIPSGPGYTDISYQSCASSGSVPGQLTISGDAYLASKYDFHYHNMWRNFGILILFTVGFLAINALISETIEWGDSSAGAVLFSKKKGIKRAKAKRDEETKPDDIDYKAPPRSTNAKSDDTEVGEISKTQSAFAWRKLNYVIRQGNSDKVLLNDVSGYCRPGQLTALVGSSGAGKSTLLTVLTQRQQMGTVTGDLMVDGAAPDSSFSRKIGYCQQMDVQDETSTIREAFEFSALLRQGSDIPQKEKLAYVDTVIQTLELTELQDAVISSLPLEQKRRTTIGVELCARPSLLMFLDEPTSGLDTEGALGVVTLLRKLADAGLAIVCTIHQANQEQIELFDRVLALNPGGNVYYFAEVGPSGKTICDYFTRYGVPVEDGKNVADLLIEVGVGVTKSKNGDLDWNKVWKESPEAAIEDQEVDMIASRKQQGSPTREEPPKKYASSTREQIIQLTKRLSRQYWRSPEYSYSKLYASVAHALINGLTYLQIGNSETDMQSRSFSCFLVLMLVPEFVNGTAMKFIQNRDLWKEREHPSRIYGWVSFTTSQILAEIPYALTGGVLFYLIFYFSVGFPLGAPAIYTFIMVVLFHLFSTAWGQWIAALSVDSVMAANLMPFFLIMCELFNGVLRPQDEMPRVWAYTMYYIAPFTYWIGGILSMVLAGVPVTCEPSELTTFHAPPNQTCGEYSAAWLSSNPGYLANPNDMSSCQYCPYKYGDEYLAQNKLSASKGWGYLGIFIGFTVFNYLIVYLLVYIFSVKKIFGRSH